MTINAAQRLAGLLVPVFALRRNGDLGIGDTLAVREAIHFCVENKITVLQLLPINETGGDNSPYNAISSVALDPALLTVEPGIIPWLSPSDYHRIADPEIVAALAIGAVQYRQVKPLKLELLDAAFKTFLLSPELSEFEQFEKKEASWLTSYSLFRALLDYYKGNPCWTQWAPEHQSQIKAESWLQKKGKTWQLRRRFHAFVQWIAFQQWGDLREEADRKKVQLMGDIPFGVSRYSADVWAHRELFDLEWSGGAPPEKFFQGEKFTSQWGQNWGIPLYHWKANEAEDFRWWRQRVQKTSEIFNLFRIDHVLGFFRIYSFPWLPERNLEFVDLTPEEAKAKTGGRLPQFLPGPDEPEDSAQVNAAQGERLLSIILEAAGKTGVVAEDLGVVPNYVRPLLQRLGIPGFSIPFFERNESTREFVDPQTYPPLSLATYATHDHSPLKVLYEELVHRWVRPEGHEAWLELNRILKFAGMEGKYPDPDFRKDLHEALLRVLMESPSWLAVLLLPDLLGTAERYNEPGSAADSNWSQRLASPLSTFETHPKFGPRLKFFRKLVRQSGRI